MTRTLVPCGEKSARFARMFSGDMEGHTPSWPCAQCWPTRRSGSLQNTIWLRPQAASGILAIWTILAVATAGCTGPQYPPDHAQGESAEKINVFVGLPPYAYLVQRIGGERVHVGTLLEAGRDAHSFALSPKQSLALGRSQLIFIAGMPFERAVAERLRRAANLKVVDVTEGLQKRPLGCSHSGHSHRADAIDSTAQNAAANTADSAQPGVSDNHHPEPPHSEAEHQHDDCCPHCHGEATDSDSLDPHVWLSPPLLKKQAQNIAAALIELDPAGAEQYRTNLERLLAELDGLHTRIAELLRPHRGRAFYVFHPAFGYFAETYGLREVAIESAGKPPTQRQLRQLIHQAARDRPGAIFVQPQYDSRAAKIIADAIGAEVLVLDDLAFDVIANLEQIAQKIAVTLQHTPAPEENASP